MSKEVPRIAITIDDTDINTGALEILKKIRPEWNPAHVEFKLLTDGITNKLVGCKLKSEEDEATVLVRVYGNKTDLLIDRKAETRNILLLSNIGLAPSLYATFRNGLAYQFVPGCTLNDHTVTQPEIYKLVAQNMAKLHKTQVPDQPSPKPFLWDKFRKFLDLVPDTFSDCDKDKKYQEKGMPKLKIEKELQQLKAVLMGLRSPVVFAHNDLLLGNVIYTEEKQRVTFIDYEYAGFNYQAYDIGNHFAEFAGIDNIDYSKYPNRKFQYEWFKIYLEEYKGNYSSSDLDKLYIEVNGFALASHLFWGIWALIQAEHSYIDFDFLEYAQIRFDEYFAKKDQFLPQLPPKI